MLVLKDKPKSIESESYKTLRTNIKYSSKDNIVKTILITSTKRNEGKTTIASNLSLSFAENNQSVILLDCNFRKPSIHEKFNISNEYGLADVLMKEKKLEEVIQKYNSNLSIISAGKMIPNPSEIIGSKKMNDLIKFLKNTYDIIIIDSPPVGIVTDAQILATQVDGTIIVVKADDTKYHKLIDSIELLKKVKANILGVVLNKFNLNVNII